MFSYSILQLAFLCLGLVVAVDARCCLTIDPTLIGLPNYYFILLLAVLLRVLLINRHKNPPVQKYSLTQGAQ